MFQNVLKDIGGIGAYAVISLLLFVFVFGGALVFAFLQSKDSIDAVSALPLEEEKLSRRKGNHE